MSAALVAAFAAAVTLFLRLSEPVASARREVREHNLLSLHAAEDVASWVRDEHQAFSRRLIQIDQQLAARGMLDSGERGHQINEARRDQHRRWRDRERGYRRTLATLHAQEGFWHEFWRSRAPRPLRLPRWPAEDYVEDVRVISGGWTDPDAAFCGPRET